MVPEVAMPLVPETVVERGELWTVAVNRNQNLLGKCLVVLNRPEVSVVGLSVPEWMDLHRQMARLRVAIDDLFAPDQYNYAFLMNIDSQVHLHAEPRYRTPRRWRDDTYVDERYGRLFVEDHRLWSAADLDELREAIALRLPG
jgi:diadenosine tetraphosphate (Ap4A) HIT family hydrolase